jgi:hypothetical protein
MWTAKTEPLSNGRVIRFELAREGQRAEYADVITAWQHDAAFRTWFNQLLADSTFTAFRWETPPLTVANTARPFEFVLHDSPGLAAAPDVAAFAEHFHRAAAEQTVVQFSNLGRDAILVVPCPLGPYSTYGHLAAFVRHAPPEQQQSLWQTVGEALQSRLNQKPVWLSTAGAGVSWLHVRLDDQPKYYGYAPYRDGF